MSRAAARMLSLLLMLVAFPLISIGTTGRRPAVWWLGCGALALGALIPLAMRFLPERKESKQRPRATDLGDSGRVC